MIIHLAPQCDLDAHGRIRSDHCCSWDGSHRYSDPPSPAESPLRSCLAGKRKKKKKGIAVFLFYYGWRGVRRGPPAATSCGHSSVKVAGCKPCDPLGADPPDIPRKQKLQVTEGVYTADPHRADTRAAAESRFNKSLQLMSAYQLWYICLHCSQTKTRKKCWFEPKTHLF